MKNIPTTRGIRTGPQPKLLAHTLNKKGTSVGAGWASGLAFLGDRNSMGCVVCFFLEPICQVGKIKTSKVFHHETFFEGQVDEGGYVKSRSFPHSECQ